MDQRLLHAALTLLTLPLALRAEVLTFTRTVVADYEFSLLGGTPLNPGPTTPFIPFRAVGDLTFSVLHVPGHTPGHLVFVNAPARFALVGDTLFQGSVGRTDFPYGNHDELIGGIKGKLLPLGDDVTILPGHGPASTIGAERSGNGFLQR